MELKRAALAKQALFSTIVVFRNGNRILQLRYRKVRRPESTADEVLSDPVPFLRRELASPELSFRGRQERGDSDRLSPDAAFDAEYGDSPLRTLEEPTELPEADEPQWTGEGLAELLDRLDDERPVQAQVIRAAAQQPGGWLPRALVYELGEYEAGRTLRCFTRPVNRITLQLQREGLVALGVAPALEAVYEHGVQATYLAVPPDVQDLLWKLPTAAQPSGAGQKKSTLQGSDDFLTQIPSDDYRNAPSVHLQLARRSGRAESLLGHDRLLATGRRAWPGAAFRRLDIPA